MGSKIPVSSSCENIVRGQIKQCGNFGLWFNYFIELDDKNKPDKDTLAKQLPVAGINELLEGYHERSKHLLTVLDQQGYCCRTASVHTESRLAAGMGNPNPTENGMTFQYPLGFPIIPGSSQKGVTAIYAEMFEGKEQNDPDRMRIFGSSHENAGGLVQNTGKGSVLFFDAYPVPAYKKLLEFDIMNPHYEPYYSTGGENPPADYYSPVIIKFLTVPAGIPFCFQMASRSSEDLDTAWKWLREALTIIGIGGKTNVGYGRFRKEDFNG